ncbi:MAG: VOC family protein [Solirubrobacterales bacterium]
MSERSEYKPGEFCWVDLGTSDVDAAAGFYGELLGWKHEVLEAAEEMGGYGFFLRDGKQVAGIGPLPDEGTPPAWSSYVMVADADETLDKVKEAGGNVLMGPIDLPAEAGRMAVCQDTAGAFFSIIEQNQHKGAELVNEPGSWTWNQLATRDIDGAKDFYGKVFGWELEQAEGAPPDSPFFIWQVDGQKWEEGLAGAMTIGSDMPADAPPNWQVYFAVEDADAAIEKTKGAGGALFFGPQTIPVGKLAVLSDPQGAVFAIIEPDYAEPR